MQAFCRSEPFARSSPKWWKEFSLQWCYRMTFRPPILLKRFGPIDSSSSVLFELIGSGFMLFQKDCSLKMTWLNHPSSFCKHPMEAFLYLLVGLYADFNISVADCRCQRRQLFFSGQRSQLVEMISVKLRWPTYWDQFHFLQVASSVWGLTGKWDLRKWCYYLNHTPSNGEYKGKPFMFRGYCMPWFFSELPEVIPEKESEGWPVYHVHQVHCRHLSSTIHCAASSGSVSLDNCLVKGEFGWMISTRWCFHHFFLSSSRKLGKWCNLTNIFQMGWCNQQRVSMLKLVSFLLYMIGDGKIPSEPETPWREIFASFQGNPGKLPKESFFFEIPRCGKKDSSGMASMLVARLADGTVSWWRSNPQNTWNV